MSFTDIKKINQRRKTSWDRERQSQIAFFRKKLEEHEAKKPQYDINETDEEKQQQTIKAIQAWATSYGVLIRKLGDLGYGFERDSERLHKQSAESGQLARQQLEEQGSVTIGDLQIVPDSSEENQQVRQE
jgi:hypothetical protein